MNRSNISPGRALADAVDKPIFKLNRAWRGGVWVGGVLID